MDGLWAAKSEGVSLIDVQLVSKISNLCDPDPPTLQTDGQTDRRTDRQTDGQHAISIPRYALVHRAVKIKSGTKIFFGVVVHRSETNNS